MSEDWQVGDLAECMIDDCMRAPNGFRPEKGGRYMVTSVSVYTEIFSGRRRLTLRFIGSDPYVWFAVCFRKIRPDEADKTIAKPRRLPELTG